MKSTTAKGIDAEQLAAEYLLSKNYKITHTRWKHGKYEIDLIAEIQNIIVFVEVKSRYTLVYGEPWEAVNRGKRKRICAAANAFIEACRTSKEPRFDIISIVLDRGRNEILHLEDAFRPEA